MTQPTSPTDHSAPAPHPLRRAASAFGFILLVAAAGAGYYYMASRSNGLRAQEPSLHDTASFYTVEGSRITVPATSPLRMRLDIAEIQDRSISRNLTLPAVVEADPARTAKVLPPVAGRVTELKVQLGARVRQGDVLAVIEFQRSRPGGVATSKRRAPRSSSPSRRSTACQSGENLGDRGRKTASRRRATMRRPSPSSCGPRIGCKRSARRSTRRGIRACSRSRRRSPAA